METDLFYMRARYYDPGTGRFISEDPAGLDGGLNLYAYVGGNPISRVDPSGLTGLTSALILRGLQGNEQAADTLGEFSRLSGAAAVFSSFAGPVGQPGVVGFGVTAFGSSALEQMIRPDLGGAAGGAVLDVVLDQLPSRVGGPAGIAINEIRRNQDGRSGSNFITPSNMGLNPNISFGSCTSKCF